MASVIARSAHAHGAPGDRAGQKVRASRNKGSRSPTRKLHVLMAACLRDLSSRSETATEAQQKLAAKPATATEAQQKPETATKAQQKLSRSRSESMLGVPARIRAKCSPISTLRTVDRRPPKQQPVQNLSSTHVLKPGRIEG
eukprot:4027949-Alexandrium_andersonii.AAC.2